VLEPALREGEKESFVPISERKYTKVVITSARRAADQTQQRGGKYMYPGRK